MRYVPDYDWGWDYNDYEEETIYVNYDFFEIKETYDEIINLKNIKVIYNDNTTQTLSTENNEFGYTGYTKGIRWDYYKNYAFHAPVYKTTALNSTNIKYIDITYEREFLSGDKTFTIRFENKSTEFKAISEIEL